MGRRLDVEVTYACVMARRVEHLPNDPVLVVIDDDEPTLTFDAWLDLIATDEQTDVDAGAAETLREIREHGER